MNGAATPREQLAAGLRQAVESSDVKRVVLQGDKGVQLGDVVYILDEARAAGAAEVAIAATRGASRRGMAREDLLLAPESLEALIAGMAELGVALGPQAGPGLVEVRARLEQALAARKGGDGREPSSEITARDAALAELAETLDPQEAAMMRALAGQFEQALRRGDAAHAADSVDAMRKRSGAVKKRGDEFKL